MEKRGGREKRKEERLKEWRERERENKGCGFFFVFFFLKNVLPVTPLLAKFIISPTKCWKRAVAY